MTNREKDQQTCIECSHEAFHGEEDLEIWLYTGRGPICPTCWGECGGFVFEESEDEEGYLN